MCLKTHHPPKKNTWKTPWDFAQASWLDSMIVSWVSIHGRRISRLFDDMNLKLLRRSQGLCLGGVGRGGFRMWSPGSCLRVWNISVTQKANMETKRSMNKHEVNHPFLKFQRAWSNESIGTVWACQIEMFGFFTSCHLEVPSVKGSTSPKN